MEEINIDDFMQIDLRIAKVVEVSEIEEADKLVQLKLDLGELGEKTVFAGIKIAKGDLVDRVINVYNAATAK